MKVKGITDTYKAMVKKKMSSPQGKHQKKCRFGVSELGMVVTVYDGYTKNIPTWFEECQKEALESGRKDLFENWIREMTGKEAEYNVFPVKEDTSNPFLTQPGWRLAKRGGGQLDGINRHYFYVSRQRNVGTSMHKEDCELLAINLLHDGQPKVWLIVPPLAADRLEQRLSIHLLEKKRCTQWVRHHALVLSPHLLDSWSIPYSIQICRPSEFIFTIPNTYHQVFNLGPNIAESVNVELPGVPLNLSKYVFCTLSWCGSTVIRRNDIELPDERWQKRKNINKKLSIRKKQKISSNSSSRKQPETRIKKEEIMGKEAIERGLVILKAWHAEKKSLEKEEDGNICTIIKKSTLLKNKVDRVVAWMNLATECQGKERLFSFLGILARCRLAKELEEEQEYRIRRSQETITEAMKKMGLQNSPKVRQSFHKEIHKSKEVLKALGEHTGLLFLLPTTSKEGVGTISLTWYIEMTEEEREEIESNEMVKKLEKIGDDFEEEVFGGKESIETLIQRDEKDVRVVFFFFLRVEMVFLLIQFLA